MFIGIGLHKKWGPIEFNSSIIFLKNIGGKKVSFYFALAHYNLLELETPIYKGCS